jgi:redox-sensing transcriptional repressor
LGHALSQYEEFHDQGFQICAIFDHNLTKVGSSWDGIMVYSMDRLDELVKDLEARIGVVAVPATAGQEVADRLVLAGVEGILNFSPVKLSVPEPVYIRNVNLAIALESLSYSLTKHKKLKLF